MIKKSKIKDLVIISNILYKDKRGYFKELLKEKKLKKRFPFLVMSFSKKSFTFKENLSYIIEKSKSNSKIFNVNYYFGNLALNILIFFKLIDLNFYHKALLTENIVLNTKKIFDKLRLDSNKSSKDILLENYNYYVKNLKKINNIKSGSDKKPSLKIFNIFKIFSKFF